MFTGNHLPMLCAIAMGSTGSANSWERDDRRHYKGCLVLNPRQEKITRRRERRALRRHEAAALAFEMPLHGEYATQAETFAWAMDKTDLDLRSECIQAENAEDERLAVEAATEIEAREALRRGDFEEGREVSYVETSALFGTTFDPDECGWGFTVSERLVGSHGGTPRKASGPKDEAGRWLAIHDPAAA